MTESTFLVEAALEDHFAAQDLGKSIFPEADTMLELHAMTRDTVPVILIKTMLENTL